MIAVILFAGLLLCALLVLAAIIGKNPAVDRAGTATAPASGQGAPSAEPLLPLVRPDKSAPTFP